MFRAEWRFWLPGALVAFALANLQVSGLQAGIIPALQVPYRYEGDMLFHSWMVQRLLEGGLYENPRNGYPFGSSFLDYPGSDLANHLLLKGLAWLGGDFQSALNLFFLIGFVVTFIVTYLVLRALGLRIVLALAGALIYDFMPFHFLRLGHLFYTWYFSAPLFFYLGFLSHGFVAMRPDRRTVLQLGALSLVLVLLASFGVYNALFGVVVLMVCGLAGALARRNWRPLALTTFCAAAITGGVLLNVLPHVFYRAAHGPNLEVAQRHPLESELYALKFVQLVMPMPGHRNGHLAAFTARYNQAFPQVNENSSAALGAFGAAGLLVLMVVMGMRLAGARADARGALLGLVVATLFMFGTVGGFGAMFALLVSPAIRGWNRISIFIGFGAVLGLLLYLQIGIRRWAAAVPSWCIPAGVLVLTGAALYDQVPASDSALRARVAASFEQDRQFIQTLESQLPAGAAVYQLPYVAFPESPPPGKLGHYEQLVGFLHSRQLRWSHGGMKGRPGDLFFRALSKEPVARQAEVLRRLGFAGVYLNRRGFDDNGQEQIAQWRAELGQGPSLERADGQVVFFRLTGGEAVSLAGLSEAQIIERAGGMPQADVPSYPAELDDGIDFARAGRPAFVRRMVGLSVAEGWGRWSDANVDPVVRIDFASRLPKQFVLVLDLQSFGPNVGKEMLVRAGGQSYRVRLPATGQLRLPMQSDGTLDAIEFHPPQPTSPQASGQSGDGRRLGVGFRRLWILPG